MTPALYSRRRELGLLLTLAGIQFTHIVDFMIMMPLGPQLTRLFGISDAQFGLLVSSYTFAAGLSGLLAAGYIDRFDRKRLLLTLYAGFALATLACGLAPTFGSLMAARIAAGAFGGVLTALAHTIVADVIPFERRGRAAAVVMSAFSLATVAGVPGGLWLAAWAGWNMPFIAIALLCGVLASAAALSLPALRHHLTDSAPATGVWRGMGEVLADANHRRAFVFSALLMGTGFTTIPYITLFTTSNAGLRDDQIPLLYLCGGIGSLLTARWVGRLTDRYGKVRVFGWLAVAVLLPLLGIALGPAAWQRLTGSPLVAPVPVVALAAVVALSTAQFVVMSGRMIPGMAILASAADPARRGSFMAFNGAVQSAAMGLAALVGGAIISRDANGLLRHYWGAALLGCAASLASWWVARRLTLHTQQSGPNPAAAQAKAP
jgi:predicted MFS family arabinose efflux permease